MKRVIMMKGLPASGKSTVAKEMCKDKLVSRVNRDLLREMFNYGEYSGKNEKIVVQMEQSLVRQLFGSGIQHVIVDDCNLNPKNEDMWREIAHSIKGCDFEVHEVDTDVEECVKRDADREKSVGEDVIRNMALQYGRLTIDKPVVICDIDGTIADCKHRLHHLEGEKKDWDGFFSGMYGDKLRQEVYEMLTAYEREGVQVVFVSARPEEWRDMTILWLMKYVEIDSPLTLLMRRKGDSRDDTIVKREIYDKYLSKLDIVAVIDDRPKVLRMWDELGLTTVDVGEGKEF